MKISALKFFVLFTILIVSGKNQQILAQVDTTVGSKQDVNVASPVSANSFNQDSLPVLLDSAFIIRSIDMEGNKITRDLIIQRELPFKVGDTIRISQIPTLFNVAKTQIMNTSLFHESNLSVSQFDAPFVDIKITFKERWYLFPFPYFKPVDRNLNQWLFEKGASISRLDYGVKLLYDNVTGNKDKLKFYFITGYTKQISLGYKRPYIDKGLKWGFNFDVAIGKNHEVVYNTLDDKQVFLKTDDYLRNFFKGNFELTYRKAFYTTHHFGIGYQALRFGDSVFVLNPHFFKNNRHAVKFGEIYYNLSYQNLDYNPYPTKGHAGELRVSKQGFNNHVNVWQITAKGVGYWHLGKRSFYSLGAAGTIKAPFKQPFYNSQLLGYGDMFMRGYEYYVIDGVAGGFFNATLLQQLTDFKIHIPRTKWFTPRLIPLKIYGKVFGNAGYVHNPQPYQNRLPNKMLLGGGIGLDIFTMYDFTLKLELSFNHLGQNDIYLQKKDIF